MRCASQKMRISELEVEYEDILWFAIDKFHRVIAFTSGVYGHVPEFVCRSKEETILIENYFDNCGKRTEIKHIKGIEFGEKLIVFFTVHVRKTTVHKKNGYKYYVVLK